MCCPICQGTAGGGNVDKLHLKLRWLLYFFSGGFFNELPKQHHQPAVAVAKVPTAFFKCF